MPERSLFDGVLDAYEGFAAAVDGELRSSTHRRGIKVWYGEATKEHYEAQLIRQPDGGAALEIGFHAEYPSADDNDAVIDRLRSQEAAWRSELGDEPEVGVFLGADRWRRISELWEPPDPDDPEAAVEIGARLADYALALEPHRTGG